MSNILPGLAYYQRELARSGPSGVVQAEVCIYGGTASGVIAAIQTARLGRSVVLLEPSAHLGGMTASGLGFTDIGNKAAIGGLAREFYRRTGRVYGVTEAWTFEPHVAERILNDWVCEAGVVVHRHQFLDRVERDGARINAVRTESGLVVRAGMFIDASYEGDLMARAGISYHVGREANETFGESLNGAQVRETHQFEYPVSPYVRADDPASGLLPGVEATEPVIGAGDHRVQAYCFRMCLTDDPANRRPFSQPAGYDRRWYIALERYLAAGWRDVFRKFDRLRVRTKTDTNNHGAVSTDFIGQNHAWPDGSYAARETIFQAHVAYQQGLQWFLAHDPAVPRTIRNAYSAWGLCQDEFPETGGWPHQLYVREARRMIGGYLMTEHECRGTRTTSDPIALAAYTMDSHNCRRFARYGRLFNEGDVQVHGFPPYPISYRSITPQIAEGENLLVPVCLSATHIAYGSIRMEPVFMALGHAAATAAHLALEDDSPVQAVPYPDLRAALLHDEQVLAWDPQHPVGLQDLHAKEA